MDNGSLRETLNTAELHFRPNGGRGSGGDAQAQPETATAEQSFSRIVSSCWANLIPDGEKRL